MLRLIDKGCHWSQPVSRIHAKGQDKVYEEVSVPCWDANPLQMLNGNHSEFTKGQLRYEGHTIGENWRKV